jgi:hypothetical protein
MVEKEEVAKVLREQVIKRDTLEGEPAMAAERRFNRRSERAIGRNGKPDASDDAPIADGQDQAPRDAEAPKRAT